MSLKTRCQVVQKFSDSQIEDLIITAPGTWRLRLATFRRKIARSE
jgi:hypothetical protein